MSQTMVLRHAVLNLLAVFSVSVSLTACGGTERAQRRGQADGGEDAGEDEHAGDRLSGDAEHREPDDRVVG